ncbi:sensor histidine kinase [Phytoactinopolyspora limicola]|uniref:sensor histidine kinase n=1 Tax=Phytoactinopolyspora limicola TaxID=2715536 RepID=UPI0014087052|nr:histidine kinase [Phytoactinopolyspora limicola]
MRLAGRAGRAETTPARWVLPGEIALPDDDRPTGYRRTLRDWAVDFALFGAAALIGVRLWMDGTPAADQVGWAEAVNPWVGAAACAALWLRRRCPVALVVAMMPAMWLAETALGAVVVAIFTVAVHRRWQVAGLMTVPFVLMGLMAGYVDPEPELARVGTMVMITSFFVVPFVVGVAVRSRRQLVISLHRDAERQRREHERRLEHTRRDERERIAHEMHDVLAHRISLLTVHAGALAYRTERSETGTAPALNSAEVASAVAVIKDNADHALSELGEVLRVLRWGPEPVTSSSTEPAWQNQRLDRVAELVEEARAVGQHVDFDPGCVVDERASIRGQVQRTAYRVVQEGLTNARKHAPARPVHVRLAGQPGADLEISVTNPMPPAAQRGAIAGVGLTGLAERVAIDGGVLDFDAGPHTFRLWARLPWPHDRATDRAGQGPPRR